LEQFLRAGKTWLAPRKEKIHSIISFALENIDVLAYQCFVCDLLKDFPSDLDEGIGYRGCDLIRDVLRYAASHLLRQSLPPYDPDALDRDSLVPRQRECFTLYMAGDRFPKCVRAALPHRADQRLLPAAPWMLERPDSTVAIPIQGSPVAGRKARYGQRKELIGRPCGGGTARAEVKAFLGLTALRTALAENLALWKVIQSRENRYEKMQLLLICGIYGPAKSMATCTALKILKLAMYGSPPEEWNLDSLWESDEMKSILNEYARDFEFRLWPTPQMRDAFPLFWDHRYAHITSVGIGEIPLLRLFGPDGELQSVPPPTFDGMTPLELYARYLLDEPPLSDLLNVHFQDAMNLYYKASQKVRAAKPPDQRKVLEMDSHFLNLMRTPFLSRGEEVRMKDLPQSIGTVLPDSKRVPGRAPVNGWPCWFGLFASDGEFLQMDDPLGDVLEVTKCMIEDADLPGVLAQHETRSDSLNVKMAPRLKLRESQRIMELAVADDPPNVHDPASPTDSTPK
jgi:hypothetical protein